MSTETATTPKKTTPRVDNAEQLSKYLHQAISEFDKTIDDSDEVALKLVSFGGESTLSVDGVGAIGKTLVRFTGKYNGRAATIIQNVSQVNFLLYSKPRNIQQPRRTIGFLDTISEDIEKIEQDLAGETEAIIAAE